MATWVAVIAETKGRTDFWQATSKLGVRALRPVSPHVLIDCGTAFEKVRDLGRDISRELEVETIAFAAQTAADVYCIWVHRAGERVRTLEYDRDQGGMVSWEGEPVSWEAAFFFDEGTPELEPAELERFEHARQTGDVEAVRDLLHLSSTSNFIRLCEILGSDGTPDAEWKSVRRGLLARLFG